MENNQNSYMIPGAIIVAGVLIAGAVIYSNGAGGTSAPGASNKAAAGDSAQPNAAPKVVENIRPVTDADHIRGDADAPVKIVEFSDLECPFCKRFHETMLRVMDEYEGKVAWVYRHFPLDSIHSKARKEAEASECAAALGGNDVFWAYVDRLFEITPSNNRLELDQLTEIAEYVSIDSGEFQTCLDSGKYASRVEEDLKDATNSGGRGTPYSVAIAKDGRKFVISGAQPYETVKQIVDAALEK